MTSRSVDFAPLTGASADAPGGAGVPINSKLGTSSIFLANTHQISAVEYKVNGGAWQRLDGGCGIALPVNLGLDRVVMRRTVIEGGAVSVLVTAQLREAASAAPSVASGIRAVLVGDSNTFQNYEQVFIVGASRANGIVTLVTSNNPFWVFVGSQIQVEGLPDEFRGIQTIAAFNDAARTYSYACPGPDIASIPLAGNGEQASFANLTKYMDNGWFVWSNILSNQRFELIGVFAQYGRRVSKMLAMIGEPASIDADVAFMMAGTNDTVLDGRSAAEITASLRASYKELRDSGKFVYALTIPPLGALTWSAAKTATIIDVNNWIKRYCRATPGMQAIDVFSVLVDPMAVNKGQAKTGMLQSDDLHFAQLVV